MTGKEAAEQEKKEARKLRPSQGSVGSVGRLAWDRLLCSNPILGSFAPKRVGRICRMLRRICWGPLSDVESNECAMFRSGV